jgi:hypothetical protein
VKYHDRQLALGFTGRGKSELLNVLFAGVRCQKLLLDSKNEFAIDGVTPARNADELDWRQPILHYIPTEGRPAEYDELFRACFTRRHLVVCVHELSDVCEYQASRTPPAFDRYVSQGRAHGLGLLAGSQRPRNIPVRARTESEHVYVFPPSLSPEDHDEVARILGRRPDELRQVLDGLLEELGDYSYLHFDRAARELTALPPLPEHLRARSAVSRTSVVGGASSST